MPTFQKLLSQNEWADLYEISYVYHCTSLQYHHKFAWKWHVRKYDYFPFKKKFRLLLHRGVYASLYDLLLCADFLNNKVIEWILKSKDIETMENFNFLENKDTGTVIKMFNQHTLGPCGDPIYHLFYFLPH